MQTLKTILFAALLLPLIGSVQAQQWIDKQYAYDSLQNIPYGTATNFYGVTDTLHMDLWLPQCDDPNQVSRRPLMIWFHGGAFLEGSKEDGGIVYMCREFAKRGYVTASVNYRLGFVGDDVAWNCNFPNYSCLFAADSAEWVRAYYRSVQDGKGALRYLMNRNAQYRIDTTNVFLAGESAGGFVALGVGLMDTTSERMPETYNIADAPAPNSNTNSCTYNPGQTFTGPISRPDLGGIEGTIEPSSVAYSVKGIGNIFGGMFNDLLKDIPAGKPKPAIYSFHQPCDLIVPIDSGNVFQGLSWCMTNGYNCYAFQNVAKVYGSRGFSGWNSSNGYGYTIQDEFTNVNFPYSFLIGQASCVDQGNNPCHAFDSRAVRESNMASFFAGMININPVCAPTSTGRDANSLVVEEIKVYPNPAQDVLTVECRNFQGVEIQILDLMGKKMGFRTIMNGPQAELDCAHLAGGVYLLQIVSPAGQVTSRKFVKE